MRPVTLLLVDQHDGLRRVLAHRLHARREFCVVGETSSPLRAIGLAAVRRPDIILFDCNTPWPYAAQLCARIRRASPASRLVVFASFIGPDEEAGYLRAGADRCLLKGLGTGELVSELMKLAPDGRQVNGR